MRKSGARKKSSRFEQTDAQLLETYRRLPVNRQRAYAGQIFEEARQLERVVSFDEILSDPAILEEAQRLARAAGLRVQDLAQVVNPFRYSSYFARSPRCTMAKLTSIDFSRVGEMAETIVYVRTYQDVEFEHTIIPADFDLHVMRGEIEIRREGTSTRATRASVVTVDAGGKACLRLPARVWITYVDHPLTAWIRARTHEKGA